MSAETLEEMLARMRKHVRRGRTSGHRDRDAVLVRLGALLAAHEQEWLEAARQDLGRPVVETFASELAIAAAEVRHARKSLRRWMRPKRCSLPPALWPARARVCHEPLGVVLIMAPWNYPIQLLVSPLVGALAAGNAVILKPSESAPHVSAVMARRFSEALPADWVTVVEGDAEVSERLVDLGVDKICFTGSTAVGRRIMAAAARKLTPVLLELGGKCPCVVFDDADPVVAARRIAWGKFMNAGQTCVAPDHVYVHKNVRTAFLDAVRAAVFEFYGDDPRRNPDYGRIVNANQVRRLEGYLQGQNVLLGGECDAEARFVSPTVVLDPPEDSTLMQQEIFGPVLPVLEFHELDHVLAAIRARPHPLAVYLFGEDRTAIQRAIRETVSGGVCVNDTIVHLTPATLPFGGVGESGMGAYRGQAGFEAFSHPRVIVERKMWPDLRVRYPPYRTPVSRLRRLFRWLIG